MKYDFSQLIQYVESLNLSSRITSDLYHSLSKMNDKDSLIVSFNKFYLDGLLSGLEFGNVISIDEYLHIVKLLDSEFYKKD